MTHMERSCTTAITGRAYFSAAMSETKYASAMKQTTPRKSSQEQCELAVEDVRVLISALDARDDIDDEHLDRKVGDIEERLRQQQASHEDEDAGCAEEQCVDERADREQHQADCKDQKTMLEALAVLPTA